MDEIEKEIKKLEEQKAKLLKEAAAKAEGKKGIKKAGVTFSYGKKIFAIDREIKQRKQYLNNKFKIKALKQRKEIAEMKAEAKEAIKPISQKDIFGDIF